MSYSQDLTDCFASEIGDQGLDEAIFKGYLDKTKDFLTNLRSRVKGGELPFLSLPAKKDDLSGITETADYFQDSFDDVIVLGTGGSSLGGQTLCSLVPLKIPALYKGPRLHFIDNVDPHTFDLLIAGTDWTRTGVVAISKSGSTAETIAQFAVLSQTLREHVAEDSVADHLTVITEPKPSPLTSMADKIGCRMLEHDSDIGGRYSALSVTGLLPAAIAGLDIAAIRDGAASVFQPVFDGGLSDFAPAEGAAVSVGLERTKGATTTVFMPYCDRLADFGLWYRQLWAESLGKSGEGTTPIRAMGTLDQHSQLQLYLDGPADKMYTLVLADTVGKGPDIPDTVTEMESLSYLRGRTLGDLLSAAGRATGETLANNGRPTRFLRVPSVDETAMGALMMHFMLETVIAADLIGVDPYDQPAVEEGKLLTREYLEAGN